jgi:quinohemoprotein ethanol dehydrogenase
VPGDPSQAVRGCLDGEAAAKTWDPSGKYWLNRRRRHALGYDHLRSRTEHGVHRHRQRRALESQQFAARREATISTSPRMVALNADTGKYIWHYQETPGDNWDYTSTQPMILADIKRSMARRAR